MGCFGRKRGLALMSVPPMSLPCLKTWGQTGVNPPQGLGRAIRAPPASAACGLDGMPPARPRPIINERI